MKQILTLLLLLFIFNMLNAQVFPTAGQSPVWTVDYSIYGGNPPNGSTGIEAITTLSEVELCNELWTPVMLIDTNYYHMNSHQYDLGYYRVEGEQVYWRTEDCNEPEGLLYDFTLEQGDSIYCLAPLNHVNGQDTNMAWYQVLLVVDWELAGVTRKAIYLNMHLDDFQSYSTVWVEGVGDIDHPFRIHYNYCPYDAFCHSSHSLACLATSEEVLYSDGEDESCQYAEENNLPILEDGKKYFQITTVCDGWTNMFFELNGDTTLNGIVYKKIYALICGEEPVLRGFLRTDEANSRLWYTAGIDDEVLLMDLNLEIGDVFTYPFSIPVAGSEEIQVVDIVEIDGRKEIIFDTPGGGCAIGLSEGPIRFIEGIGPTYNLALDTDPYNSLLLHCVKTADDIIYENTDTEELSYYYNCEEIECISQGTIGVNPLPEQGELFNIFYSKEERKLQLNTQISDANFIIYDYSGRKVLAGNLNQGENSIDVGNYRQGIYLITCYVDGASQTKKIIVY